MDLSLVFAYSKLHTTDLFIQNYVVPKPHSSSIQIQKLWWQCRILVSTLYGIILWSLAKWMINIVYVSISAHWLILYFCPPSVNLINQRFARHHWIWTSETLFYKVINQSHNPQEWHGFFDPFAQSKLHSFIYPQLCGCETHIIRQLNM